MLRVDFRRNRKSNSKQKTKDKPLLLSKRTVEECETYLLLLITVKNGQYPPPHTHTIQDEPSISFARGWVVGHFSTDNSFRLRQAPQQIKFYQGLIKTQGFKEGVFISSQSILIRMERQRKCVAQTSRYTSYIAFKIFFFLFCKH